MLKIQRELRKLKNPAKIKVYKNFFKTNKGQYSEKDIFIGLTSNQIKNIAKKYNNLPLSKIKLLLRSNVHEERMCALKILILKFERFKNNRKSIVYFYLTNHRYVNNWDLVDISAYKILGEFILQENGNIDILYDFAKSNNLWKKRIAIISTFAFIKKNKFHDTLNIVKILLNDKQDLIQKACGWMLREIGKRDIDILDNFLSKHYKKMPRTMLRYAVEQFSIKRKNIYLKN